MNFGPMTSRDNIQDGFSLIELILTLLLSSILASMIFPFLSTALTKSFEPTEQLKGLFELKKVMDNITADFNSGAPLNALKAGIGMEGSSQNNSYGQYDVVYNRYIKFDGAGNEIPGTSADGILKVTVKNNYGALPTLFAR